MILKIQSEGLLSALIEAQAISDFLKEQEIHHGMGVPDDQPTRMVIYFPPGRDKDEHIRLTNFIKNVRKDAAVRPTLIKPNAEDRKEIKDMFERAKAGEGEAFANIETEEGNRNS